MGKDFPRKEATVQPTSAISRDPKDNGGAPKTGFNDAPLTPQDRGGPGPGIPANRRTIH